MEWRIEQFSMERLEAEISAVYVEGHRVAPFVTLAEEGILASLWEEFDGRVAEGRIQIG